MQAFFSSEFIILKVMALFAEWDYKARYVIGNDSVGLMSAVVSLVTKKS